MYAVKHDRLLKLCEYSPTVSDIKLKLCFQNENLSIVLAACELKLEKVDPEVEFTQNYKVNFYF